MINQEMIAAARAAIAKVHSQSRFVIERSVGTEMSDADWTKVYNAATEFDYSLTDREVAELVEHGFVRLGETDYRKAQLGPLYGDFYDEKDRLRPADPGPRPATQSLTTGPGSLPMAILRVAFFVSCFLSGYAMAQDRGREWPQPKAILVPFLDVNGRMMVDLKVNGKPARLLVDTGSQHSLDLRRNRVLNTFVRGNSLEFLESDSPGFRVVMAQSKEKFDGVIGIDILKQFGTVRIDYREHVIELGAPLWP